MERYNNNAVTSEYYEGFKKPEWLRADSIPLMNTDSKLINQYKID